MYVIELWTEQRQGRWGAVLLGVAGIPGLWGRHGQLPLCSCVCEVAPRGGPEAVRRRALRPIAFVGRIPRVAGRAPPNP